MKTKFIPALCTAFMAARPLFGDPVLERELNQLKEQRDKAISAAIEPINRRYQTSLQLLMRKATQGNDLNTALKVKEALQNLEIEIPVTPGPADQDALH